MSEPNLYSTPSGYFVTLSAYGNRIHGDSKGTVDSKHNLFGEPPLPASALRERYERRKMLWPPMTFDADVRAAIEAAVAEVCAFRKWILHACHARTNHVHIVLTAEATTAKVLHDLKAMATRRVRELGLIPPGRPLWAEHGSTVYLWHEEDVVAAGDYTVTGQGFPLPGSLRPGPWLNRAAGTRDGE
jgi:REP element-mobilizing transposase RayT